ncbi:MAG: hypothetical protein JWM43_575 [Acidobacteriaceae bacterium]|nr:hypothetical protein [Acidobacteriaceae bacterium]
MLRPGNPRGWGTPKKGVKMRSIIRTLTLALLPATVLAQAPMSALKDHNRALLIFAPESTDPSYTRQQHLLENQASELAYRDLILILVLRQRMPADANQANPVFASDTEQKHLRSRYNIQPQEFAVLCSTKTAVKNFAPALLSQWRS